MNISSRFRQDLGYYFLGVIIPGLVNAITVPLLKYFLGTSEFGRFSILYNLLLLLTAFSVGWICQSIIRFKFSVKNEESFFYRKTFALGSTVIILLAVICFIVNIAWYHYSILFAFLFSAALILCCYQNMLIGVSQANFLSRFTMYSEAIRTVVYFSMAILFIKAGFLEPVNALFFSLILSYAVSAILLFNKNRLKTSLFNSKDETGGEFSIKKIFAYGLPLAVWYLTSYLLMFLDKPLLVANMGYEVQGNYQALFEIINKGAVVLMIPVLYALFPLLADAFEKDDIKRGMQLLKKVILIEAAILLLGIIAYWSFGFSVLRIILSVPDTIDYKLSGLLILASIMVWQIGMLVHKPFELKKQTIVMMWIVLASMAVFLIVFLALKWYKPATVYFYSLPFLAASLCYVFLCLIMVGYHRKLKGFLRNPGNFIKDKGFN